MEQEKLDKFLPLLEEWDISREDKLEWLGDLNSFLMPFVDLVFDLDAPDVSSCMKKSKGGEGTFDLDDPGTAYILNRLEYKK